MKKLYIVRHGETDYNLQGKVQGSGIDSSINGTGEKQADKFFENYQYHNFDKVYYSPLKRTKQTIAKFLDKGLNSEMHPGIIEICWGFHEGKSAAELDPEYYEWLIKQWNSGQTDIPVRGGDSPNDLQKRQAAFLEYLLQTEDTNILICTHGRAMRIFLSLLLNTPLSEMDQYKHSNVGLYIVQQNINGAWEIVLSNCTNHLKEGVLV